MKTKDRRAALLEAHKAGLINLDVKIGDIVYSRLWNKLPSLGYFFHLLSILVDHLAILPLIRIGLLGQMDGKDRGHRGDR